jgi:uncharacterized membrane protein YdjX (TVP38/TMEM64 family)
MLAQIRERISTIPPQTRTTLGRALALAFVVGVSLYIFAIRDQTEALTTYGYPGVFLFSVVTSATVILPAPGLLVVYAMGTALNPFFVGLAAGIGATLGELSGYLAGYSGRGVVEDTATYMRIRDWMVVNERRSGWMILFLAFIPLPFFDLAGMAAGALKMPVHRFILWSLPGKIAKMWLVAWAGAASIDLIGF